LGRDVSWRGFNPPEEMNVEREGDHERGKEYSGYFCKPKASFILEAAENTHGKRNKEAGWLGKDYRDRGKVLTLEGNGGGDSSLGGRPDSLKRGGES